MHVFFYSFFFVCSVQEMICLTCYLCLQGMSYLQCFLFVKAVSPVGHRTLCSVKTDLSRNGSRPLVTPGWHSSPGSSRYRKVKSCSAVASVPFQKFAFMRLDRLHMLILFLFLPNRNTFASINQRIVLAQPTVILVSYDGLWWDYMEKVHTSNLNVIASNAIKAKHLLNTFVTKTFFMRKATGS